MVLIIKDNKKYRVELTNSEIQEIIRCLEDVPYGIFVFMKYGGIIRKLKGVFEK